MRTLYGHLAEIDRLDAFDSLVEELDVDPVIVLSQTDCGIEVEVEDRNSNLSYYISWHCENCEDHSNFCSEMDWNELVLKCNNCNEEKRIDVIEEMKSEIGPNFFKYEY